MYYLCVLLLRLGAQSVTLLSTLRDPTQFRQRQWATRQHPPFFLVVHVMFEIKKKTQILIEFLDGTKKVQLAAKKKAS